MRFAAIKNKDGKFIAATLKGASAALAGGTAADDLTLDVLDAAGPDTYPITALTYLLLRPSYDAVKGKRVKGFVTYVLTTGQGEAEGVDYAKLPAELAKKALAQLDKVTIA